LCIPSFLDERKIGSRGRKEREKKGGGKKTRIERERRERDI
jgi:hypothetical protein